MVDVLGHLAMALLVTVPVWFRWADRPALAFIGFTLLAAPVPDVDLYLPGVVHHGPTHTVLFVAAVAVVGAAVAVGSAPGLLARWSPWPADEVSRVAVFGFVAAALALGGLVHVVFDMLSTSAAGQPVEPFWPFFDKPVSVYVITTFSRPRWNSLPLLLAAILHVVAARLTASPDELR